MSWRNPRYCYLHAARDAGAAAISTNNTFHADFPKDFLIDDRAGSLCKMGTSEIDHYIQVDRGAGTLDAIDRLIIPVGHNLSGFTFDLYADDNAGMASPTTLINGASATAAMIDEDFASNQERYVRLVPVGTGQWAFPELMLTATETTTRGPEPGWVDMLRHNTLDFEKESGSIASLSLGANRRFIEYVYRLVVVAADLTVFSELIAACGTSKPFYLDPCFDTEAAIWMKLTEDSRQQLDRASPASPDSARPEIRLSMLEHLA
jgi:hypothetical protein